MRLWNRFLLAFLCVPLAGVAQTNPALIPRTNETIEVSIVNVDVFVTDKAGNRIRGLKRGDFEVYEDGRPQVITHFSEFRTDAPPVPVPVAESTPPPSAEAPDRTPPEAPPQKRTVIVFIERFRLPPMRSDPFFAAIKKLLHETIRPGDSAIILTWNHNVLLTRQTFTDNLDALDRVLDVIAKQTTGVMRDEFLEAKQESDDTKIFTAIASQMLAANGGPTDLPGQATADADTVDAETWGRAKLALKEEERKVGTLKALMRSISTIEGKKILLLASHRLSQYAGAEFFYASGETDVPGIYRMALDASPMLRSLAETANANNVAIYPMYPEGLARSTLPSAADDSPMPFGYDNLILENETPVLQDLAKATGGIMAWGDADSAKLLPHIRDDLDSYYSLAYRANPNSGAKPHNIVVKTKDPTLTVRSRHSYVPKTDVTRMEDRVIGSLFHTPERSLFRIAVHVGARQPHGKQFLMPVTVRIPIASLATVPDGPSFKGAFSVYTAWGAKIGGASDANHETRTFHIAAAEIARAKQSYYTYDFQIVGNDSTDRVSIGVLDEVSKDYSLRVIDLQRLAAAAAKSDK